MAKTEVVRAGAVLALCRKVHVTNLSRHVNLRWHVKINCEFNADAKLVQQG
jgi:hypothetical protein